MNAPLRTVFRAIRLLKKVNEIVNRSLENLQMAAKIQA